MADGTDEHDFLKLPIEEWFNDPEDVSLANASTKEREPSLEGAGPRRHRPWRKVLGLVFVGVALIAAGIAAGLLLGSAREGSGNAAITSPTSAPIAPDGRSSTDTSDLPTLGLFDSFSRPDSNELGFTESGREWVEAAGVWSIESQSAVVSQPNSGGPSIAVANTRTTRSVVQVTMASVERAAGLVFRYENPFNYWAMTAAPGGGTWTISQVSRGETVVVGTLGPTRVDDNTTIAVRSDEDSMDFFVNGTEVTSITTTDSPGGTFVGLIGRGPEIVDARWVNFAAVALADPKSGS